MSDFAKLLAAAALALFGRILFDWFINRGKPSGLTKEDVSETLARLLDFRERNGAGAKSSEFWKHEIRLIVREELRTYLENTRGSMESLIRQVEQIWNRVNRGR